MSVISSVPSGSSHSRRYRTRAYTSQVDETLFATPKKLSGSENQGSKAQGGSAPRGLSHSAPNRRTQKPETVRIITKDLIRDLRIPSEDPSGLSVIMCPQEFQRITSASRVLTAEEKEAELAAKTRKREAAIEAAEDRKARLRQADFSRMRNAGLSELEAEARDKAQYLLEKANALRMEQEDEIKHINELILGSQCHAIRDTQILEKKQILSELQEEEKRLDAMMEVERRRAIKMQEEIDEMRKQQRIEGKVQIIQQMAERQEERLLNEEFKEQEGQQVLDKLEQLQVEEMEILQRKLEEQRQMQREIQQINEANLRAKERKKEEERLADLHALEYTRKKLEFQRITSASRVLTAEEKEAELAAKTRKREAAIEAAEDRKARLRQADFSRMRNAGLSELEAEARDKAQYLLEKANALRMEQEDEIKHINELILGSQCHAIRDTQILEKKQILSELQEEEKRLDAMMEVERRRAIKMQEEIDEMRKQQRIEGKVQIIQQMAERQEERLLNEEFKEQEGQQVLDKLEQLQVEEMEILQRKLEEQRQMQREIQQINEANLRAKERKKEEERLADLHALEYTRKKLEREAEYEAEQERIRKKKEQDVARLRALQERDRDHQAEQDALRARRNQEAAEREWRRKEKQDALNKAKEDEVLTRDRLQQVAHKEHLLSVQAGRERSEFHRVLR
ncbi:UNVERIFIED_CONTAM: hypothetical protein FKN15_006245 [Acipenser sinensis]